MKNKKFHLRGKTFSTYSDQWWILDVRRYKAYDLTLVQTYCYLDEFKDQQIQEAKLPCSGGYFQNAFGDTIPRTQFEYITDHLGYRIELQQAKFPKEPAKDESLHIELELINRGFATLMNPRPIYFVLINASGQIVLKLKVDANPQTWQPFKPGNPDYNPLTHFIEANVSLKGLEAGEYMIGLWLPEANKNIKLDFRYAVRVANRDAPWWTTGDGKFGVNILGTVTIMD